MKLASFRHFGVFFSLIGRLGVTKDILTTSNPQKNKSVGSFPNARGLVPDYGETLKQIQIQQETQIHT